MEMPWNAADFHPLAFAILQTRADNLIPLSASEFQPQELPPELTSLNPTELFPRARDAKAALSGLLLVAGHWELSHQVSQDIESREGSYWHAIAHRIEPDSSNAAYWFRRVGEHPIFPLLREDSAALLNAAPCAWTLKKDWDIRLFIEWCDEARTLPGSPKHRSAQQIQYAECNRLFSWCALKTKDL
jgi:hypothetical protein